MVQYLRFRVYGKGSELEATRTVELPPEEQGLNSMPD